MVQINSNQIVQKPEVVIDPNFFVPDDIASVRPADTEDLVPDDPDQDYLSGEDYDADILSSNDDVTTSDGGSGPIDNTGVLQTPQTITVVSQTTRATADGTTVVDVVISVEDIMGATNYEVRLSPA